MTKFTTRVELYGTPDFKIYQTLHEQMQQGGFTRQVMLNNIAYWLPNAEYTYISSVNVSKETVRDKVVKIVSSIWADFGVMVTQTEIDRCFYNLKKV